MTARILTTLFVLLASLLSTTERTAWAVMSEGPAGTPQVMHAQAAIPHAFLAFGQWGLVAQVASVSPAQAWVGHFDNSLVRAWDVYRADSHATTDPAAAANQDRMLIVYSVSPTTGGGGVSVLMGTLHDAQGNLLDVEILDTSASDEPQRDMAIAVHPEDGTFLVVWRKQLTSSASEVWGKLVTVVNDQITGPTNPSFYGDAWLADTLDVDFAARIDPPRSGILYERFIVVYEVLGGVQATFVEPGLGTRIGSDVMVGPGGHPAIATRGGGDEAVVVWNQDDAIRARRVWPTGSMPGASVEVAPEGQWPDVASSATEYLVAYRELPAVGPEGIRGRYLDPEGNLLGPDLELAPPASTLGAPSVASDGTVFLVAHTRTNGTGPPTPTDVVVTRLSPGVFTFVDDEVDDPQDSSRGVALNDWTQPADFPDLYVANTGGQDNQPFRNDEGSLVFGVALGGHDAGDGQGIGQADFDNDGDLDMVVTNSDQANSLWWTAPSPFYLEWIPGDPGALADGVFDSRSIALADYDADGLVDLCIANKDGRNSLLHNEGAGMFVDASADLGLLVANSEGVAFGDFDGDGDADLYVGNAGSANRLYVNDGGGFDPSSEVAAAYGLADTGSARTVTWVDYDADGDLDLFLSRYAQSNVLFRNDGSTFTDVSAATGVADTGRGESACFADMDLDGDQDLFLANFGDPDRLYRNDGGTFVEVGSIIGLESDGPSLGAAWGDIDLDGDPDLVVGGYGGVNRTYLNDMQTTNAWVQLRLVGTVSNASAVGARVEVQNGTQTLVQWVGAGSGYLSQNDLTLIFGLGPVSPKTAVVAVTVAWPGGLVEHFDGIATGALISLTEGTGSVTAREPARAAAVLLRENVPNPFNPATTIAFELAEEGGVDLVVHDPRGRQVSTLAHGVFAAGHHEVVWRGTDDRGMDVASGVYLYTLTTPRMQVTRKMTLIR